MPYPGLSILTYLVSQTAPQTVLLVNASCVTSPFATVQVNKPVKCDNQKWNSQQSTTAGISVVFALEGSCKSSRKLVIIIACTVGGLLLIGIVAIVIVVMVKPDLPKTMFRRARAARPGQNVYIINA